MNEYVAYPTKSYLVAVRDINTKKLITSSPENDHLLVLSSTAWIGMGFNFWSLLKMTTTPQYLGNDADYLITYSRLGDALEACRQPQVLEKFDTKRLDNEWELVVIGVGVIVDDIIDADSASVSEYAISELMKTIKEELTPEEIDVLVSRLQ